MIFHEHFSSKQQEQETSSKNETSTKQGGEGKSSVNELYLLRRSADKYTSLWGFAFPFCFRFTL